MRDNDPRPMPPEVKQAYNDPIDLVGLLMSAAYSQKEWSDVLGALMRSLTATHGDVWIAAGREEIRVSARVEQMKNPAIAIELLRGIDEYGGREGVDAQLAQAMQPAWARWWDGFEWGPWGGDIAAWRDVVRRVLGPRQFAWLAAQYARTVIDLTRPMDRSVCLEAIETAETWARVPSEANRQTARAAKAAYAAGDAAGARTINAASNAAYAAAKAAETTLADVDAAHIAAAAASYAYGRGGDLAALTKHLITPTLITHASGRLRLSSVATSRAQWALGVAVGAGAVLLAKRL